MQDRDGLDSGVEVFGEEVEEELGPEEALECGCDLICTGRSVVSAVFVDGYEHAAAVMTINLAQ